MMPHCFAYSNLLTQSTKFIFQYSADASCIRNSLPSNTLVACSVIVHHTSSPDAAG